MQLGKALALVAARSCFILAPSGQARTFSHHCSFRPLFLVQQLKGKILVKGKKLSRQEDPAGTNGNNNLEAEDVSDEDEAAEIEDETVKSEIQQKGKVSPSSNGAGKGQSWGGRRAANEILACCRSSRVLSQGIPSVSLSQESCWETTP